MHTTITDEIMVLKMIIGYVAYDTIDGLNGVNKDPYINYVFSWF